MKLLTIITTAVLSISFAFAGEPKVGDKATYNFTANGYSGTISYELTAFDAAANTFTKTATTMIPGGQSTTYAETVKKDELASTDQLQMVLALCESSNIGGTLEDITVPAGTFQTCNLPAQTGGSVYIVVVPFSLAKINTADISMELVSFKYGK